MYRLDRVCFEEAFRFSLRAMRRFAEGPRAISVVAMEPGGAMVGFAIGEVAGEAMYVVTLDVAPAWRRAGLAGRMLRWLEERAVGARWVALHVFAGNAPAVTFYERTGFALVGREEDFYGRGIPALVYRRELASGR